MEFNNLCLNGSFHFGVRPAGKRRHNGDKSVCKAALKLKFSLWVQKIENPTKIRVVNIVFCIQT